MTNSISVDGYRAVIQYDPDLKMFRGEFVGLNGGADFYSSDVTGLKREAAKSLEVFLEMCREDGVEPRSRYSGKFNLRLPPELHADVATVANSEGTSINQWIASELRASVGERRRSLAKMSVSPSSKNKVVDQIDIHAIDWAISHLKKYGDTDIFPKPFEYLVIDNDTIRKHVENTDLMRSGVFDELKNRPPTLAPKLRTMYTNNTSASRTRVLRCPGSSDISYS